MYNEKELKAALESQYSEQPKLKQTLTDELQDHLNNLAMSQDRIECLIDNLSRIMYGGNGCGVSVEEPVVADQKSLARLNNQAQDLSVKLNELGDKLAYLVNNL